MGKGTTRGFTLIELLVVVLIIAILAAVALPQYQKAVKKARFAQVDVIIDAAKKNIETYLLENGFPTSGRVILAGRNNVGPISMPGNCDLAVATCFTEVGGVTVSCQENKECSIELDTRDFADGSSGNNWLDKNVIFLFRDSVGVWYVEDVNEATQEVCKWIQDRGYLGHPRGVVGPCSELGIKIEAYQF